jgi:hypothetical protein
MVSPFLPPSLAGRLRPHYTYGPWRKEASVARYWRISTIGEVRTTHLSVSAMSS